MNISNLGDGDVKLAAWKEDWEWMRDGVKEVRRRLHPKPPSKLNWMCLVIENAVKSGLENARSQSDTYTVQDES